MNWLKWLFSKYKSDAQMRRQAIEWVVRMNEGTNKNAWDATQDAQTLLRYWLRGN